MSFVTASYLIQRFCCSLAAQEATALTAQDAQVHPPVVVDKDAASANDDATLDDKKHINNTNKAREVRLHHYRVQFFPL
jgi:hypothetical protein